jgi:hypothetical protein
VLKKSFLADERNFLGPLMRFARGDVRDHIVYDRACLNGGLGWLEVECNRCKTRASLPLDAIRP